MVNCSFNLLKVSLNDDLMLRDYSSFVKIQIVPNIRTLRLWEVALWSTKLFFV